jgi:superfamily II DNA/RNA helicase
MSEQPSEAPSFSEIQQVTQERFGKRPCLWQMKVAKAFIQNDRDIVCIAGMSLGKTMTFWMPLLLKPGIQIIVTPLNQLGKQNVDSLAKAGMRSISISAETATLCNFCVSLFILHDKSWVCSLHYNRTLKTKNTLP